MKKQIKNRLFVFMLLAFVGNAALSHAANAFDTLADDPASASAQDTISVEGNLLNHLYTIGNMRVPEKDVLTIMSADADCKKLCKQAQFLYWTSYGFGYLGGGLLGYGAVDLALGKETYRAEMLMGCASLAVGFGFEVWMHSRMGKAINLYNRKQGYQSADSDLSLNIGLTSSGGIGLQLNF